jgi:hypothetical protein
MDFHESSVSPFSLSGSDLSESFEVKSWVFRSLDAEDLKGALGRGVVERGEEGRFELATDDVDD